MLSVKKTPRQGPIATAGTHLSHGVFLSCFRQMDHARLLLRTFSPEGRVTVTGGGGLPAAVPPLTQDPLPRPRPGTGPWPVRTRAAQQEESGGRAGEASSASAAAPSITAQLRSDRQVLDAHKSPVPGATEGGDRRPHAVFWAELPQEASQGGGFPHGFHSGRCPRACRGLAWCLLFESCHS